MKRLTIDWINNDSGPKVLYSSRERFAIYYSKLEDLAIFKTRIENDFKTEGIYLLRGEGDSGVKKIYIGETNNFNQRLSYHTNDKDKQYIDEIIFISSENQMLPASKDELHFIEKHLISLFNMSGYQVENKSNGQGKPIKPTDKIMLEEELSFIKFGIKSFGFYINDEIITTSLEKETPQDSGVHIYANVWNSNKVINAIFHPNRSITISEGQSFSSLAREYASNGEHPGINRPINLARNTPSVEFYGDAKKYEVTFLEDTTFKSPSGASALIRGGSNNGWVNWKIKDTHEPISILRNKK